MFGIGPMELVLILVVALLVLGPKRMPDLARTLGRGMSEFRKASNDLRQSLALDDLQNELRDGLSGVGNIQPPVKQPVKTPDADDLPPQAGDDLAASPPEKTDEAAAHPGELPLDADPTEHHDRDDSSPTAESEAQPIDSELGNVPIAGTRPTAYAKADTAASDKTRETPTDSKRG